MNDYQGQSDAESRRRRRVMLIGWVSFAFSVVLFLFNTIWYHSKGEGWLEATGLVPSGDLFRIIGDLGVPVIALVLMMQRVNKLPPNREKTVLRRIGWTFFVFLFVWWVGLRPTIFSP